MATTLSIDTTDSNGMYVLEIIYILDVYQKTVNYTNNIDNIDDDILKTLLPVVNSL